MQPIMPEPRYALADIPSPFLPELVEDNKVGLLDDDPMTIARTPVQTITMEGLDPQVHIDKVDDESSYGFWYPQSSLPNLDPATPAPEGTIVIPRTLHGRQFLGHAEVKIAAKEKDIAIKIPVPEGSGDGVVALNRVQGLTSVQHNASIWGRIVKLFKEAVRLAIELLFVVFLGELEQLKAIYYRADADGLKPRMPWESDKGERINPHFQFDFSIPTL